MPRFDYILVDGNYWARKFFSVHKQLCAKVDGKIIYTGMAHGFLLGLCSLKDSYRGSIIVVWDSGHTRRRKIDQSYKAERRKKNETWEEKELYSNHLRILRIFLKLAAVKQASKEGEEGDDILYTLAKNMPGRNLIVTNDHDLYQALDRNIQQLLSKKTGEKILSQSLLERETGLTPSGYGAAMALAGCSGDGVAGVPGVGLATAMEFVRAYPNLVTALLHGWDTADYRPKVDKKNIVVSSTGYFKVGNKGPGKKLLKVLDNPDIVHKTRQLTMLYNVSPVKIRVGKPNIGKLETMLELAAMHECASRIGELGGLWK